MSSFGEDIRRERELRRITLREVADSTKITLRYLEALEKNDFDVLPGGVFNRGFVRAYAEYIGIDPESSVTAYLLQVQTDSQTEGETLQPEAGPLVRGHRVRGNTVSPTARSREIDPRWYGWLLILIALAVLFFGGRYLIQHMSDSAKLPAPTSIETSAEPPATRTETSNVAVPTTPPVAVKNAPPLTAALDPRNTIVYVDRSTTGRLNCDNLQIETLDGAQAGTRIRLNCSQFLIIDAADAGALRLALAGGAAQPVGNDGDSLVGYRVEIGSPAPDPSVAQ